MGILGKYSYGLSLAGTFLYMIIISYLLVYIDRNIVKLHESIIEIYLHGINKLGRKGEVFVV